MFLPYYQARTLTDKETKTGVSGRGERSTGSHSLEKEAGNRGKTHLSSLEGGDENFLVRDGYGTNREDLLSFESDHFARECFVSSSQDVQINTRRNLYSLIITTIPIYLMDARFK